MRYNTCLKWLSPGRPRVTWENYQATMKHQGSPAAQPNISKTSKTKREKHKNSCKFPKSILQSWMRCFSASWIFFVFRKNMKSPDLPKQPNQPNINPPVNVDMWNINHKSIHDFPPKRPSRFFHIDLCLPSSKLT